jgi:uncharacterized protein YqeY
MGRFLKRAWRYLVAALSGKLDQLADPKVQVEQAIEDAIRETGAQGPRDQGKVMGLLSSRLRGRADMKSVASRVQALLTG